MTKVIEIFESILQRLELYIFTIYDNDHHKSMIDELSLQRSYEAFENE